MSPFAIIPPMKKHCACLVASCEPQAAAAIREQARLSAESAFLCAHGSLAPVGTWVIGRCVRCVRVSFNAQSSHAGADGIGTSHGALTQERPFLNPGNTT
jgi:hypothetical protein